MTDKTLKTGLWTPRSPEETQALYRDWAVDYDADVLDSGYVTPTRVASALANVIPKTVRIIDFGCGTGLSGQALYDIGFKDLDGTDVTQEMLSIAKERGIYKKTWLSDIGEMSFGRGAYGAIVACGVVSLGAAPASTLGQLVAKLETGGVLALSFNDPTLQDDSYSDALVAEIANGRAEVLFREHGPHLPGKGMGSDVIVLRRR